MDQNGVPLRRSLLGLKARRSRCSLLRRRSKKASGRGVWGETDTLWIACAFLWTFASRSPLQQPVVIAGWGLLAKR